MASRRRHFQIQPIVPLIAAIVLTLMSTGCQKSSRSTTRYPPPPPPAGQAPGPGQPTPPPGQPAPTGGAPGAPPAGTAPPAPPYAAAGDPINNVNLAWMRNRAQTVLTELVAALDPGPRGRVGNIPLIVDDTVGEVNAFAACTSSGRAAMAISDGLLEIQGRLAQAQAIDELFRSHKADEYIRLVASQQRPGQPIVQPPPGFFDANQNADPRKLERQHQIYEEELAFVLGHELAHHYLGHLPCTAAGGALTGSEINAVLSSAVPAFNQGNEVAADVNGVNNVLNAGKRRSGYRWTEGGASLSMRFFAGLDQFSVVDIVFAFERSHPPPALRQPIIQQAAAGWRTLGGRSLPVP